MNSIYLLIFVAIVIVLWLIIPTSENFSSGNLTGNLTNQTVCKTCPLPNVTCKDASGQTYYSDPVCADPSNDKWGGLGCIGSEGCRYCGFGVYSSVPCPNHQPPNPPIPYTPLTPNHPIPYTPLTPSNSDKYKVNLINQCPVTVLAAALGPTQVKPSDNKSWILKSGEQLSIDIPREWESTAGNATINGPRFWARTGCEYDTEIDRANCEGGDCGGKYDCSAAALGGSPPGSWAEFCFNCGNGLTYYDVSLVDGAHMSMDIKPVNQTSSEHPGDPSDPFWCKSNLCNAGQDLRDPSVCPTDFQLKNTQLKNHNPNNEETVTACFSNCGKWAYLKGQLGGSVTCDPNVPNPDPYIENVCKNWRIYCCQSPSSGQKCSSDTDCQFGEACWNGSCQCRAYYRKPCDPNICTHPYCECNNPNMIQNNKYGSGSTMETFSTTNKLSKNNLQGCPSSTCPQGFSTQPKPTICSGGSDCIGDDTLHNVCPQAYTWPNDPQTYDCNAKEYNVTFCPGGTSIDMADSKEGIPDCAVLGNYPEYGYSQALQNCSQSINNGNLYACARKTSDGLWACGLNKDASCYNLGVLCKFDPNKINTQ